MKQNSNMHYDLNAEAAILSAMMIDSYAASQVITEMEADYFYRGAHKIIYNTMLDMYRRNVGIDMLTLISELKRTDKLDRVGGEAFINDLSDMVMTAANMKEHMRIVKKHYITRQVLIQAEMIAQMPGSGVVGDDLLEQARQNLYNISASKSNSMRHISSVIEETLPVKERIATGEIKPEMYYFGLPSLDSRLVVTRGSLTIIQGRRGHGKTALAQQFLLHNAKRGKVCLLITGEMKDVQTIDRYVASGGALTHGEAQIPHNGNIGEYMKAAENLYNLPIYIDPKTRMSADYVRSQVMKLKHEIGKVDIVVVDYIQIMKMPNEDNKEQRLSELSLLLKNIALDLDVAVVTPAQENKEGGVRESEGIENNADIVLRCYRPAVEKLTKYRYRGEDLLSSDFDYTDVFFTTRKQRSGSPDVEVRAKFDGDHQRFYEIYEEV
jgi:replicative DNA helicase